MKLKTKPYYPRPWQIPGLLSGEITRVLVPIKLPDGIKQIFDGCPQWPDGEEPEDDDPVDHMYVKDGVLWKPALYGSHRQPAPYQPGDVLAGKEAWARVGDSDDDIHACPDMRVQAYYRVDAPCPEFLKWRSPVTMPAWAVRLHLRVLTVEAVRVAEIGRKEARQAGYKGFHGVCGMTIPMPPASPEEALMRDFEENHGPDAWGGWAWSYGVERVAV